MSYNSNPNTSAKLLKDALSCIDNLTEAAAEVAAIFHTYQVLVERPAVIGMLCHLQDLGKINITFHAQARLLHRNPYSIEEWEAWCESQMPKRRIIKK